MKSWSRADIIKEVSDKPIKSASSHKIDCGKRVLMPGLIDCHVHVYLSEVNLRMLESIPVSLLAAGPPRSCSPC